MPRLPDVGRLGGGLIAAAVGMSRWNSPLDAYRRITGEVVDDRESEDMDRGNFLEPALRNWYGKRAGALSISTPGTLQHPNIPWATYTPDGIAEIAVPSVDQNGRPEVGVHTRLLEIKSPGLYNEGAWGEVETDQVPRETHIQGAWGVAVTYQLHGITRCDFAAFLGGKLRLFKYERDIDLEEALLDKAKFFMRKFVETRTPPPPTFAASDTEYLKKKFPRSEQPALSLASLTPQAHRLVQFYCSVYKELDEKEKQVQEFENQLKVLIADSGGISNDLNFEDFQGLTRIDWKNKSPAMHAGSWKNLAEELLGKLPDEERKALLDKHTPKEGSRAFTPYWKKGSKK